VVDRFGSAPGFVGLGAVAAVALLAVLLQMPATTADQLLCDSEGRVDRTAIATLVIVVVTYGGIAIGRFPGLRLDRAGIAFLGGAAMIGVGAISIEDAYRAIDFDTITLLLGMMIVVAHLKVSGVFRVLAAAAVAHAHRPMVLLSTVTVLTGVLSAFLVNDAICLVMAPLVVQVCRGLGRNPVPYLVATAAASNGGSVATITGNPQNMVIGALSGIPFPDFSAALAPVALVALAATVLIVRIVFAKEFRSTAVIDAQVRRGHIHPWQMAKAITVTLALAVAFFLRVPVVEAALVAGAVLLVTRSIKPRRIYREIDGPLLLMFAGLFVVVAGAERTLLTPDIVASVKSFGLNDPWRLSLSTAVLSNLVSNVPAVLALRPFVADLADPQRAWLIVAMASTLAGNFTLLGSVANLIVAEQARGAGVPISFGAYFRMGLPLTLVTLVAGTWWLAR
jgi:Na+/H+ antiporter NhaD/arsenite permease-like protein